MKHLFLFFVFVLCSFSLSAQDLQWAKSFGDTLDDIGHSVAVDDSANVYVTGKFKGLSMDADPGPGVYTLYSNGPYAIFITKFNANGDFIWAKSINCFKVGSIAVDDLGYVYIEGVYYHTVDFDPGPLVYNLTSQSGTSDPYILKLNSEGDFVWVRTYGGLGGYVASVSIYVGKTGAIFLTGAFSGTVDLNPCAGVNLYTAINATSNSFIICFTSNGNSLYWIQVPTGSSGFSSIALNDSGYVYASGSFSGVSKIGSVTLRSKGLIDFMILKFSPAGSLIWAKSIGGLLHDEAGSIVVDSLGNCYLNGAFESIVDFDPGFGTFNLQTSSSGNSEVFILKLNTLGKFVWAKKIVAYTGKYFTMIKDNASNIIFSGYNFAIFDVDPGPTVYNLNPGGYIVKLSSAGNFIEAQTNGGNEIYDLAIDKYQDIYATGYFESTYDFDSGTNIYNLTSIGNKDAYLLKLGHNNITDIENISDDNQFSVFPNPAEDEISINLKSNKGITYRITDISGKLLKSGIMEEQKTTININDFVSGIYFIHLSGINYQVTKFLKL